MAVHEHQDILYSDLDPTDHEAVDAELLAWPATELCVRNNRRGPTDKRVIVHMWTDTPSHLSFVDRYLPTGEVRATNLIALNVRVIQFEIRWKIIGSGSAMWATTGVISAASGEFFPAFGIRWHKDDTYSLIFPD